MVNLGRNVEENRRDVNTIHYIIIAYQPIKKAEQKSPAIYCYLSIGMYRCLFSVIIQSNIAQITNAMGKPAGATVKCVHKTPTITGKTTKAPNALVLGMIISRPPNTSAKPTKGINHDISIIAAVSFYSGSGKLSGTGM